MDSIISDYDFLKSGMNIPLFAYLVARFVKAALLIFVSFKFFLKKNWDYGILG